MVQMVEARMTISDLDKALKGVISWVDFCKKYTSEKKSYLLRNDGALTSADLKMKFDIEGTLVEKQGLDEICSAALEGEISESDVSFIANVILLSAFDFADDALEDVCHFLSDVEKLDEIREVKSALSA